MLFTRLPSVCAAVAAAAAFNYIKRAVKREINRKPTEKLYVPKVSAFIWVEKFNFIRAFCGALLLNCVCVWYVCLYVSMYFFASRNTSLHLMMFSARNHNMW